MIVDCVQLSERTERPLIVSSPGQYEEPQVEKYKILRPDHKSGSFQGGEVVLKCVVTSLGNNNVVWKQGERIISAGRVMGSTETLCTKYVITF